MKGKKKNYREYFEDIKPVTDEELDELLDDSKKRKKRSYKKKDFYRDF